MSSDDHLDPFSSLCLSRTTAHIETIVLAPYLINITRTSVLKQRRSLDIYWPVSEPRSRTSNTSALCTRPLVDSWISGRYQGDITDVLNWSISMGDNPSDMWPSGENQLPESSNRRIFNLIHTACLSNKKMVSGIKRKLIFGDVKSVWMVKSSWNSHRLLKPLPMLYGIRCTS